MEVELGEQLVAGQDHRLLRDGEAEQDEDEQRALEREFEPREAVAGERAEDQHAGGRAERDDQAVEQPAEGRGAAQDRGVIGERVGRARARWRCRASGRRCALIESSKVQTSGATMIAAPMRTPIRAGSGRRSRGAPIRRARAAVIAQYWTKVTARTSRNSNSAAAVGIAELPAAEGDLVDEQHDRPRGAARAAGGQQLRLAENLQLRRRLQHDDQHDGAADGGQGDPPEASSSGSRRRAPQPRTCRRGSAAGRRGRASSAGRGTTRWW